MINETKPTTTIANRDNITKISYLLTDALDYILVGSAEDEVLVLRETDTLSTLIRQSSSISNIAKP